MSCPPNFFERSKKYFPRKKKIHLSSYLIRSHEIFSAEFIRICARSTAVHSKRKIGCFEFAKSIRLAIDSLSFFLVPLEKKGKREKEEKHAIFKRNDKSKMKLAFSSAHLINNLVRNNVLAG